MFQRNPQDIYKHLAAELLPKADQLEMLVAECIAHPNVTSSAMRQMLAIHKVPAETIDEFVARYERAKD